MVDAPCPHGALVCEVRHPQRRVRDNPHPPARVRFRLFIFDIRHQLFTAAQTRWVSSWSSSSCKNSPTSARWGSDNSG